VKQHLKLHSSIKSQRGFTLIELLVAIAITAVIGSAIAMAITQILSVSIADKNRMEAVKQVENALHDINRDAQTASSIVPTSNDFPLALTWNEWNVSYNDLTGPRHVVTYTITTNQSLQRVEAITVGAATTSTTRIIATHIADSSNCSYSDPVLTLNLTASIGGYKAVSETRSLTVQSRPELLSP
jgi:prepilin-type N-terminal cleavage/methylation domain-containing protein